MTYSSGQHYLLTLLTDSLYLLTTLLTDAVTYSLLTDTVTSSRRYLLFTYLQLPLLTDATH